MVCQGKVGEKIAEKERLCSGAVYKDLQDVVQMDKEDWLVVTLVGIVIALLILLNQAEYKPRKTIDWRESWDEGGE